MPWPKKAGRNGKAEGGFCTRPPVKQTRSDKMAESKEKKYIVASPILYTKKRYEIEEPVTMEAETGDPLVEQGILIDPSKKAAKGKEA
jgi:hypothetical protein